MHIDDSLYNLSNYIMSVFRIGKVKSFRSQNFIIESKRIFEGFFFSIFIHAKHQISRIFLSFYQCSQKSGRITVTVWMMSKPIYHFRKFFIYSVVYIILFFHLFRIFYFSPLTFQLIISIRCGFIYRYRGKLRYWIRTI